MTKITPEHLARGAFIYVRQSTADQLLHNHESRRRQYGLAERARQLGGKRSSSSTTISVVLARASVARVSNACWRRSVKDAPARYSRSRLRAWHATVGTGINLLGVAVIIA